VNHPLSLAVLRRGIRTRHTQLNTPREEEGTGGVVIELTPVVTLDGLNDEAELSGHPDKEVEEGGAAPVAGHGAGGGRCTGVRRKGEERARLLISC
jgi:hypothetical protein